VSIAPEYFVAGWLAFLAVLLLIWDPVIALFATLGFFLPLLWLITQLLRAPEEGYDDRGEWL
jgi:hypothetical protein